MMHTRLASSIFVICLIIIIAVVVQYDSFTAGASVIATPTFSKDIAPIFAKSCMGCHRPGEIAPMSLMTFKEARPWAKAIREKVINREMPPWHADPKYGDWENDRRLTQKDLDTITAWVVG
ncbi:MAG: cytochrome c, partial [Acidobacteria bacterium]|nr:cytochrome c [Acidobacteriota bacterium]